MKNAVISSILLLIAHAATAQGSSMQTKIELLLQKSHPGAIVNLDEKNNLLDLTGAGMDFTIPYYLVVSRYLVDSASQTGEVDITCNDDNKCITQKYGLGGPHNIPMVIIGFPIKEDAHQFVILLTQLKRQE